MNTQNPFINKQTGLSLVEALVSLFIFSIGALGLAALQMTSIVQSDDLKQRSMAIWKGQELVERIRSSRTFDDWNGSIEAYTDVIGSNDGGIAAFGVDNTAFTCAMPVAADCSAVACSREQLARFDINQVLCDANTGLQMAGAGAEGSFGLMDMDIALRTNAANTTNELYIAWQSRTANRNFAGVSSGAANGVSGLIPTNLCGTNINVDVRVDAICIQFQ